MSNEKRALGKIALQKQATTPADPSASLDALRALSEKFGVPGLDLTQVAIPLEHLALLPREIANKHMVLPVLVQDERIFLAMANPSDKRVIDELEFVTGKRVFPYIAPPASLARVIEESYELKMRGEAYYLGPAVPREVLVRLGLAAPAPPPPPPTPLAEDAQLDTLQFPSAPPPSPAACAPSDPRVGGPLRGAQPLMRAVGPIRAAGVPSQPLAQASPALAPGRAVPSPTRPIAPPPPLAHALASPTATRPLTASRPQGAPPRRLEGSLPESVMPPRLDAQPRGPSFATSLADGDFMGGSDLSTVTELPTIEEHNPIPRIGGSATGNGKLVLVVDDEDEIRKLLKRVLVDRGYRVIEADRGTTALRLVKEHVPDVIVLDAMLPELHGFEICRRIKGSQKYGQIPIIMISAVYRGWRYAEDLRQNYGVDQFLEKPFKISDVVKAVEAGVNRRKEQAAPDLEQISADAEKALQTGIAAYQGGDIDAAIDHLKAGSAIDPLAYRLHYHLGLLYGKKGQVYEAIQALETAVEINGRHFPALKNLAVLYQKAGLKLKAIEMWERSASQAPDDATKQGIKDHLLTLL